MTIGRPAHVAPSRRALTAVIASLAGVLGIHSLLGADVAAAGGALAPPTSWRGWIAVEQSAERTLTNQWPGGVATESTYGRAWAVDVQSGSTSMTWYADDHQYSQEVLPNCGTSKTEFDGSGMGSVEGNFYESADLSQSVAGVPAGTPGVVVDVPGGLIEGTMGNVDSCNEDDTGYSDLLLPSAFHYNGGPRDHLGAPLADSAQTTMAFRHAFPVDANGVLRTFQVCLTRSSLDTDGDRLPDAVDLDPLAPGDVLDLGAPAGVPSVVIPARIPGINDGSRGLPSCPSAQDCFGNPPPTIGASFASPYDWRDGLSPTAPHVEVLYSASASDAGRPLPDESYRWTFRDDSGSVSGAGHAQFRSWLTGAHQGRRTARLVVTDDCGATAERSMRMDVSGDPVRDFAPVLYLHPDERWFPMATDSFLAGSTLRFTDHQPVGQVDDQITVARRGTVDGSSLGGGGYLVQLDRDIHSDDRSRPYDQGNAGPHPKSGFSLDLDNHLQKGARRGPWPTYLQVAGAKAVYWLFFGYSQPFTDLGGPRPLPRLGHEGDWERVVLQFDSKLVPRRIGYVAHHEPVDYEPYLDPSVGTATDEGTVGLRPVGFVALGGHGTYPREGVVSTCDVKGCLDDYTQRSSRIWDLAAGLVDITSQPWFGSRGDHAQCAAEAPRPRLGLSCGFGGAWGHRGSTSDLTGPLGPSAYKVATANR